MASQRKSIFAKIIQWLIQLFPSKNPGNKASLDPYGGPSATSATVRVTRPEKGMTIQKLTAIFASSVNSTEYLNGTGNIVLTNTSLQSDPLTLGDDDNTLVSTSSLGSLGDLNNQVYKMKLNLNSAEDNADSETKDVTVTIT